MKNRLLLLLLALLGFTGCSDSQEPEPDMYGTPFARFTIKGRVKDSQGKPIQGIRVTSFETPRKPAVMATLDGQSAVFTSLTGEYEVSGRCFDRDEFFVTLRMDDVDGEKNGLFDTQEIDIGITQADRTHTGGSPDYRKQAEDTTLAETAR